MHRVFLGAGIISVIALGYAPALAQPETSRYTMAPTEGGFVRLDTVTGAMSFCSKDNGGWSCTPMENGARPIPGDRPSGPGDATPEIELPSEEDVDKAIDYLESMIRKFRERFEDFGEKTRPRREASPPDAAPSQPDGPKNPAPSPKAEQNVKPDTSPDFSPSNPHSLENQPPGTAL